MQEADHYDELSHMVAIMHFHNAIELVLQNILLSYGWATPGQMRSQRFDGLLDMVDKKGTGGPLPPLVPSRAQIIRLTEIRNSIMHHGQRYHRSEVQEARNTCGQFLSDSVREFFEDDISSMSMSDLVENSYIRLLLQQAERYRDEGEYAKAVGVCVIVVRLAEKALNSGFRRDMMDIPSKIDREMFFAGLREFRDLEQVFKKVAEVIQEVADRENRLLLLAAGVEMEAARRFFNLGFHVYDMTALGDQEERVGMAHLRSVILGIPEANLAIRFATDVSLKVQALDLGSLMTRLLQPYQHAAFGDWDAVELDLPPELEHDSAQSAEG